MIKKTLASVAVLGSVALAAVPAFAQTTVSSTMGIHADFRGNMGMHMGIFNGSGVFGTVAAVNGSTITVTSRAWAKPGSGASPSPTPAPTTYTVDATNAKVMKAGAASAVSAIAVGDRIMVAGTVSGTNVTATTIRDLGLPGTPKPMPTPVIQGNGQPVVSGKVTAVSGSTLTVTNASNVTYTVDASIAKVEKSNATASLSSVAVGDQVVVQGTFNGTSVVAYSVIDASATAGSSANPHPGFLRGIGQFFQHLFGF